MNVMYLPLMAILSASLVGCTTFGSRPDPQPTITLDSALGDVADSLNDVRQKTANRDKFGLLVDQVQVTFNVSDKATNDGKLGIAPGSSTPLGALGLTASTEATDDAERSNQIIVTFKNIATADMSKSDKTLVTRCDVARPPKGCPAILNSIAPAGTYKVPRAANIRQVPAPQGLSAR